MTFALLAPVTDLAATSLGRRLWRKQVLKKGTIDYQGRKLVFDDAYLADLAASHRDGAYDQVAFVMAGADNAHTLDPERFRGQIRALEVTPDGLDAILELSEDGSKVVEANPELGVSCRIVEALTHSDGRSFKRAVQHVLGTLDPRVTGMSPWQPVNLAGEPIPVVDLTAVPYTEGASMAEFTDEEMAGLRKLLSSKPTDPPAATDPAKAPTGTPPALSAEEEAEILAEMDRMLADKPKEPVTASLSAEAREAIDLAAETARVATERINALEAENASVRWTAERNSLLAAGIPKAVVDLAQQVIAPQTIDLSNGATAPASADVVRQILAEFPRIDLSTEIGYRVPATTPDDDLTAKARVEAFHRQFNPGFAANNGGSQ